jgi:hypothetical protein
MHTNKKELCIPAGGGCVEGKERREGVVLFTA